MEETPVSLHLFAVALLETQAQFLEMVFPSFLTLKRSGESTHTLEIDVGVGCVGDMTGDVDRAGTGAAVGAGTGADVGDPQNSASNSVNGVLGSESSTLPSTFTVKSPGFTNPSP